MHDCQYDGRFGLVKCLIDWHEDKADMNDDRGNDAKRTYHERKANELREWLHGWTGEWFFNDRHYHPEGV